VTPGREGLLAPPGQPDALARAVEYLLNRPRLRRQMGQAGQHTARRYSWDSVAENVLAVYHRVAKTAQPAQTGLPAPANLEQRALPAPQRALRRLTHDV
ncbi:MAG: glycosyltransferase family 1 protein, partial [Chloroflexi bacterium]